MHPPLTRRRFLTVVAALAAVTGLPEDVVARDLLAAESGDAAAAAAAAALTTLAEALGPGAPLDDRGYRPVVRRGGEPHVVREDLAAADAGRVPRRRSLASLLHLTDQHVLDSESPARVEFTDRLEEGDCSFVFSSAWRPHEAASARIADAMLRRVRAIAASPVTGVPLQAAVCTGDNIDNQQANEVATFLAVMDGGRVLPGSGDPAGYEGVQASGDLAYWHPDPSVPDRYKDVLGFPARAGWLDAALAPFDAAGLGLPWFSAFGNHDGLVQGNAPANPLFEGIATGGAKVVGPPPDNPCTFAEGAPPLGVPGGVVQPTTPDAERRFVARAEWVQAHLDSPGLPRGHGFTQANVDEGTAYYAADVGDVRLVVLDTVNPGGNADGSIGDRQLQWLDERLAEADAGRRLVLLWSHHGLRSLENPVPTPDPADPEGSDLPRRLADDVRAVVDAHPCVIAWVNGHTHLNTIEPARTWWDIGTAAHIDWPAQSRLVEVVDNGDGTLSILTTIVDHEDDPVASFARELMGNDPQAGFATGAGRVEDRNTELLLRHPFAQAAGGGTPTPTPSATAAASPTASTAATPVRTPTPRPSTTARATATGRSLPATGGTSAVTAGGLLALLGAGGVVRLARRRQPPHG